jgi:NDP-sugar pyrophosphorylase family protein
MKRAVVLAGGRGTRLLPYTIALPKPLVPIGDAPILEIIIRQLVGHGFSRITLAVNHQADILRAYFGDGSKWGVEIDYSLEKTPLGTMGPLKLIPDLPDNFLVMNGDILTDLNYAGFFDTHVSKKRLFTISSAMRSQTIDYGVLEVEGGGSLVGFIEKPVLPYVVSMGIYCLSRQVVDLIPDRKPFGFDNLVLDLIARRKPVSVVAHDGYWLDIGRPDDYQKAIDDWPKLKKMIVL